MNPNAEYEKMPKNLKGLHLSEKAQQDLNKLKWVVTEKIHGANFSFVYENHQLLYAKRKDYLKWTDDFFSFQAVAAEMEDRVLALFEQLKQDRPAGRYILYGELFGGKYPHPEVAPDPNVQAIQTGVYYSPAIRFCAFDIALETAGTGLKTYLDYEVALAYFERFGIFHARVLFSGKINEVLNFNTRIDSTIPRQLQLPELSTNLMEGVVIKPLRHSDIMEPGIRPIIKLKNPEFDEEKKFHEAEKWSFIPGVSSRSEELSFLVTEMAAYITENRLNSAISKTGRLDFTNTQRVSDIRQEFLDDIFADFNIDHDNLLADLEADKVQWLRHRIGARIIEWMAGMA
ncbi:RNA ligase family protein [Chitinophaga eiseniae]|uniref:2'-5' RNA ligase n=1 Tax=Chitinophaga eiseniae TaxID=634771 RepID=A0A847SGZ3_9BACT|nr:RNA ligase family protein [Chitinophaga eiseniae]NLR82540.1 2'-5' RNA ligase [Chitinophaga eiseniae]